MNTCSPKAYTISGCDSMQADLAPQYHLTPLILAPVGGKTVALDCDGGRGSVAKLAFGGQIRKSALGKSITCESQLSCFR
jgi:hypothetical protein